MWIEKRVNKSGTVYKYCERFLNPLTGKREVVSVILKNKSRETQKEAQRILDDKISLKLDNEDIKRPDLTFHVLSDEWLKMYKKQVEESTYYSTVSLLKSIQEEIPDTYLVSGIKTHVLNDLFEKFLYEYELSNNYVKIMKAKMNLIFEHTLRKKYISSNPVKDVSIVYPKIETYDDIKEKFFEDEEYKKIIQFTYDHNQRYALLFEWMYLTGMRIGEATSLSYSDIVIGEDEQFAVVNGTLQYRNRKVSDMKKSKKTKTPAGMRDVDLPDRALTILEKLQTLNNDSEFIFSTARNTPIQVSAVNTYMRTHLHPFVDNKQLSSHTFRHTHVSKLAELGVPLYVIQERVGHEDSGITEKIYMHVTKKVKKNLKEKINTL